MRKLNPLLDSDDELEQDEESPLNWVEASLKVRPATSGKRKTIRKIGERKRRNKKDKYRK